MGFFSKITRAITKPIKKIIKSSLGKMALMGGLGYLGGAQAGLWGKGATNPLFAGGGRGNIMAKLFGTAAKAGTGGAGAGLPFLAEKGFTAATPGVLGKLGLTKGAGAMMPTGLGWAGIAGLGGAAAAAQQPKVDELESESISTKGHDDYLKARKLWDWGGEEPMFGASQGGRVHAQHGMAVGQDQGIASLDQVTDPASLSDVSQPVDQGVLDSGTTEQSDDARLIQLIQQLAALGIPMEQLRGRTEQELVEMMVYLSSQMGSQQGGNQMAAAQGGRVGLQGGGDNSLFLEESSEVIRGGQDGDSVVDETENIDVASYDYNDAMAESRQAYEDGKKDGTIPFDMEFEEYLELMEGKKETVPQDIQMANQGGLMRTGYAMGTEHPIIPSKDGKQLDMRDTGGYQPHGAKEKHDDVRALLAQGEFVMTSDAVKGLGGGDREAGAKKMYDVMHNLEAMA